MDHAKDKKTKWRALHIYEGVKCAKVWMRGPGGARVTGCNADGIALQFHADIETGKVIVKELKETNFYPIGDGDELLIEIESQLGGEEGIEQVRMERLYELWGGKESYDRLFGLVRNTLGNEYECPGCGKKLTQDKMMCWGCKHEGSR